MPDSFQPQISFVATSRNDDHGGDMLRRMKLFVKGLEYQCEKFRLRAELIIVEWNPPADKPFLEAVLPASASSQFFRIRYIRVPNSFHKKFRFADSIPLFQMIAKNVGIRRAKADWICATNVDILFSGELFSFLASGKLNPRYFYRANRIDYPATMKADIPVEQQMNFAWKNQIERFGKNRRFPNLAETRFLRYLPLPGIEFLLQAFSFLKRKLSDPVNEKMRSLDTDACGDFTLMHKNAWHEIRGYAEIDLYSIHIDSLALISATACGYTQEILHPRAVTYHMEHGTGWASPDPLDKFRLNIQRPGLDWSTVKALGFHLLKTGEPLQWNNPTWGLQNETLEECAR